MCDSLVLSNVWWPLRLKNPAARSAVKEALVLWLNSSLGLTLVIAAREETRGAWVKFKKPALRSMSILNVLSLSTAQLDVLTATYKDVCQEPLMPLPQISADPVRMRIDEAVARALQLPDLGFLRKLLANEPIISLKAL
jgi:hypothetical protein